MKGKSVLLYGERVQRCMGGKDYIEYIRVYCTYPYDIALPNGNWCHVVDLTGGIPAD